MPSGRCQFKRRPTRFTSSRAVYARSASQRRCTTRSSIQTTRMCWPIMWANHWRTLVPAARYCRFRRAELLEPRPLLDGAEIAERFQLRGLQIGAAVRALVEAQVQGLVTSRESAEQFLRSMLEPHA